jgi:hypothetical protein
VNLDLNGVRTVDVSVWTKSGETLQMAARDVATTNCGKLPMTGAPAGRHRPAAGGGAADPGRRRALGFEEVEGGAALPPRGSPLGAAAARVRGVTGG